MKQLKILMISGTFLFTSAVFSQIKKPPPPPPVAIKIGKPGVPKPPHIHSVKPLKAPNPPKDKTLPPPPPKPAKK